MNPKYPVYIPSKGRWETRLTSKALELMNMPYYIVVEKEEYEQYASVISPKKILVLPFSNKGLFSARNWIMEHSISLGAKRHWQLDDNIEGFCRFNNNYHVPVTSGTIFRCAEDFVDRYENIAYAGFQYDFFVPSKVLHPAFVINTRIYSCTLVNNAIPFRWRSLYNDDTDVCLQALKEKWCTILFYAFIQLKSTTMTIKGGNTEDLYLIQDGRLKMAEALKELHPNLTRVTWKWGRWQHQVNYTPFKRNKLIKKKGLEIKKGVDNYGMKLKKIK
jgi:hypothetical protein